MSYSIPPATCRPEGNRARASDGIKAHRRAGRMPVWLAWLAEAQGEPLLEMSQELDQERRVSNDELVVVSSARGKAEMVAVVSPEFKPFTLNGKTVHEVEGLKTT